MDRRKKVCSRAWRRTKKRRSRGRDSTASGRVLGDRQTPNLEREIWNLGFGYRGGKWDWGCRIPTLGGEYTRSCRTGRLVKGQRNAVPYLLPKSTATARDPTPPQSARTCNWVSARSRPGRRRGPWFSGRSRRHEQQCLQAAMTPTRDLPGLRPDWLALQAVGRSLMQFRFRGAEGSGYLSFLRWLERVISIWTRLWHPAFLSICRWKALENFFFLLQFKRKP